MVKTKPAVDAKQTSQICPHCGVHTGKKPLSQRIHFCSHSGRGTHRDVGSSTSSLESRCRQYIHHRAEKYSLSVPVAGDGLVHSESLHRHTQ
ncbi:zinc ribbon domain-containing protein [Geitlerinema sp. PCC 9228]|uniref:zinc ribbon domain-containing protein n=1 Tax=Geitlerinema sp. PCC 9228 TaxID=111611 RepID=UPI001B8B4871|nr:zinc ribbon domain-containing protein [Geitlerinema sp. PCC 9228]